MKHNFLGENGENKNAGQHREESGARKIVGN